MRHFDRYEPAPRERHTSFHGEAGYRRPSLITRDGASMRMVAAMAERPLRSGRSPFDDAQAAERLTPFAQQAAEDDAQYYRRRSREECQAAGEAASAEARAAHQEIANHYAHMSRAMRDRAPAFHPRSAERARVAGLLRRRFGLVAGDPPRPEPHAFQAFAREKSGIPV